MELWRDPQPRSQDPRGRERTLGTRLTRCVFKYPDFSEGFLCGYTHNLRSGVPISFSRREGTPDTIT